MSTSLEFDEKQQASLSNNSNKPIQTNMRISTGDQEGTVMQMMQQFLP